MHPITYVHAASLRLETPLAGLNGTVPEAVNQHLADAGFVALSRLVALCLRERPDFLLLCGNTLDERAPRLDARLRLAEAFAELHRQQVPVFVLPGETDPASLWQRFPELPPNVRLLHEHAEAVPILRDGKRVAMLHAAASPSCGHSDSLPHVDSLSHVDGLPHIGAALSEKHLPPALTDDARNPEVQTSGSADPVIWALGQDTAFRVRDGLPVLSWSGAAQGLRFDEPGLHGCAVTTLRPQGETFTASVRFEPLSPVEWRTVTVPMGLPPDTSALHDSEAPDEAGTRAEAAEFPETLTEKLSGRIARALSAEHVDLSAGCELVVLRILLEGVTPLDARLREPGLRRRLLERLADTSALFWPAELVPLTREPRRSATPSDSPESRPDLAGELVRLSNELDGQALNAMAREALAPLLQGPAARPDLRMPEEQPLRELVRSAVSLCLDQLDAADGRTAREKF